MKQLLFTLLLSGSCGLTGSCNVFAAQKTVKTPAVYKPVRTEMYKKGWIDFNKNGAKDVYEDPAAPLDARIEDLLGQMTLEEKTCQMVTLYGYKRVLKDDLPTPEWKNQLWKDGIGAIDEHLNGFQQWGLPPSDNENVWPASRHAWALNEVQRFFIEETRLGIPTDFTNEGIRGVESYKATNFPTQLGLGHTWNRRLIHQVGLITGREARMLGYTNVYAPILDVGRDQRWGRYEEVYGESPYLVAELGIEMVRGLQHNHQVAATGKHFIAYSNNKGAREGMARVDPQMSPRELEMVHVYPFKRVIREAGLLGVMSSYNDYDGFPIQSSYYWLTTRLRGEMGFRGYVVSDSDAVEYLYTKHGTAGDMKEAVRQSVEAGLNVRCTFRSPESYVLPLRELVREGGLSEEVIDNRVRDILRVKFLVGLFDHPYQTDLKGADEEVEKAAHEEVALQASRESIVLLKNEKNLLPLNASGIRKIAVCGPNADEESYALSHYGPLAVEVTSVLEGIREKMEGKAEVLYSKGCELVDAHWPESELIDFTLTAEEQSEIDKAVGQAKAADVAIVVLGGGQRTCGENKSRTSLDLPGRQLDLLKAVVATGKPVVLVLINGRPLSINWADKFVSGIIEAWYPGSKGGKAVADVLFGDYNPGGKLTVTFPKTVGQIPFNFPYKPASQIDGGKNPGPEGNMSRANGALYPFGHGLSYTTFEYSDMKISPAVITPNQQSSITCKVTNTGKRDGDEVVQLYVRDVLSSVTTYEKKLAGFERVHLKAGETKEISFPVDSKALELLNADMHWVVEPGDFALMLGASSTDIRLNGMLTVVEYGNVSSPPSKKNESPVSASTNQETARNVMDNQLSTQWEGNKGDYITFALPNDAKVEGVSIAFHRDNGLETDFEIQLSSGGGQFLTVYSGTVKEYGKLLDFQFKGTTASDLRIVLGSDRVGIAEVRFPQIKTDIIKDNMDFAQQQLRFAFHEIDHAKAHESPESRAKREANQWGELTNPRNTEPDGTLNLVPSRDWTSGFFPGELWYLYEYTQNDFWKEKAQQHTDVLEREKLNGTTHDMGFKMYCSFGNGYRLTHDERYKEILLHSARTLTTRYKPKAGIIRSWDHGNDRWDCPVIIDNMMNLELLFWATKESNDSTFYHIAVNHARTTLKNHFRPDFSSYHVVDYDTITGQVLKKNTHQGYAHESAWSRGQAWALYGYTVCYRETGLPEFLEQAGKIERYLFTHKNMPEDLIPYWDFDAPGIPDEPRDVSAATVIASALYELCLHDAENGNRYKANADKMMENLTKHYRATLNKDNGFLLLHSTGTKPTDTEVDVPIVYADYYFIEALMRKKKLETKQIEP